MPLMLANFLRWFGTFSIGYFGNDLVSLADKVTPQAAKDSSGKPKVWWILIVIAVVTMLFMAVLWLISSMGKKKRK